MKARLVVFLLTCCGWLPAQKSSLEQAAASYRQRYYEAAASGFAGALTDAGDPAGELLYDLGNCAFRLGRHAHAIWYYRRALLRLPRDREVRFNLALAEQRLGVDALPDESLLASLRALRDLLTPAELLALAFALQCAGACGAVLLRRRRGWRNAMIGVMVLGLLCWGRVAELTWFGRPLEGIVLRSGTEMRPHPDPMERAVVHLEPGATVQVIGADQGWLHVVHPRGSGWTESANVGRIE